MLSIFKKEITSFFSSLIAYIVVAVFLVMTGLFMWVFNETSILNYNYASLDQLFLWLSVCGHPVSLVIR